MNGWCLLLLCKYVSAELLSTFQSRFLCWTLCFFLEFVGFSFHHLLNFIAYSYYFLRLQFLRLTDIENRLVAAKAGQGGGETGWQFAISRYKLLHTEWMDQVFPGGIQRERTHLPMQETWEAQARSLGREGPLEEGMAPHSSIPAWRIPWTEGPGDRQPTGLQRVGHDWSDLAHAHADASQHRELYSKSYDKL